MSTEMRLTPDEWVEATKKVLIEHNKEMGRPKAVYSGDYRYIGMAVIVAENIKNKSKILAPVQ